MVWFKSVFTRDVFLLVPVVVGLVGCPGGASDQGTVAVRVSGEDVATQGFAADELADGWTVSFDALRVSFPRVDIGDAGSENEAIVVDLVTENEAVVMERDVSAERHTFGFTVAPPPAGATGVGVDDDGVADLRDGDESVWVAGRGEKAGRAVTFDLGFNFVLEMSDCTNGVDDTDGIVVDANATTDAEVTMHLEHLLYDKLGGHDGVQLRFDAWAVAAGDDDVLTTAELRAAPLSTLPDYDPVSVDVNNLHAFVSDAVADMFHLNGEGLCTVRRLSDG